MGRVGWLAVIAWASLGCQASDEPSRRIPVLSELNRFGGEDEAGTGEVAMETPANTLRRRLALDRGLALALRPQGPPPRDDAALVLGLHDALGIAAHQSSEYQQLKQAVFEAALSLDLQQEEFRQDWEELLASGAFRDGPRPGAGGGSFLVELALDLVGLLDEGRHDASGLPVDPSIVVPLLRGARQFELDEPLGRSLREVVHQMYALERFKRVLAVNVADAYYSSLAAERIAIQQERGYRWIIGASRRAMRASDEEDEDVSAPLLEEELVARRAWIDAIERKDQQVDRLRRVVGLPPATPIVIDMTELDALEAARGSWSTADPPEEPLIATPEPRDAILIALEHRRDLRSALARVFDTQRRAAGERQNLLADQILLGSEFLDVRRGSGRGSDAVVAPLELPPDRLAGRGRFAADSINYGAFVRTLRSLEFTIRDEVLVSLRALEDARVRLRNRRESAVIAERRVRDMVPTPDVIEARNELVAARNGYTDELVHSRLSELRLQRDMGLLQVDGQGLWAPSLDTLE